MQTVPGAAHAALRAPVRRACRGGLSATPARAAVAPQDPERHERKFWFLRPKDSAPSRRQRLLGELAMLNERLSGGKPHEVRQRVEWIQRRRRNWELIYQYVTRTDAAVTLSLIEAANAKVRNPGCKYQSSHGFHAPPAPPPRRGPAARRACARLGRAGCDARRYSARAGLMPVRTLSRCFDNRWRRR